MGMSEHREVLSFGVWLEGEEHGIANVQRFAVQAAYVVMPRQMRRLQKKWHVRRASVFYIESRACCFVSSCDESWRMQRGMRRVRCAVSPLSASSTPCFSSL